VKIVPQAVQSSTSATDVIIRRRRSFYPTSKIALLAIEN